MKFILQEMRLYGTGCGTPCVHVFLNAIQAAVWIREHRCTFLTIEELPLIAAYLEEGRFTLPTGEQFTRAETEIVRVEDHR